MKKPAISVILSCVCGAVLLRADFEPSRWKFRRPLGPGSGEPIAFFNLDRDVYIQSRPDLGDVRVISGGEEIPYVLETMSGSQRREEISSHVIDQGVTSRGDLELTVDVGGQRRHNGIRFATGKINFRQRVGIAASDDGRHWTRVRDDGYVFDFSQDGRHTSDLYVSYPLSTRRYVRATIYGWNDPGAVTQCRVSMQENAAPVRDVMATLAANAEQDAKTQARIYTWDLGTSIIPHDQISLEVDTPAFQRAATIETSRDGKQWSVLGSGVLSRFDKEQSLAIDFPTSHDRYLRMKIYNRDDHPLAVTAVTLSAMRVRVIFKPAVSKTYWVYYGNPDAHAPSYDLREMLAREAPVAEAQITPGEEERNPEYREKPPPAKPWTERHPEILYAALALAVIAMGTVTVRFLKKASAEVR